MSNTESFMENIINSTNVSATTKALRISYLKRFDLTRTNVCEVLSDTNIIRAHNINTWLSRAWHIVSLLKAISESSPDCELLSLIIKYMSVIQTLNTVLQRLRRSNRQTEEFVSLNTLQTTLHSFKDKRKTYSDYERYALLSLYIDTPALRNDYVNMKVVNNVRECNDSDNYLVHNKRGMYLILSDYKTVMSFGKLKRIDIENDTKIAVSEMLEKRKSNGFESQYLFNSVNGNVLTHHDNKISMIQRIKRASKHVYNVPYSINVFRHAWETYIQHQPNYASLTLAERDVLHHRLLHHLSTALEYNRV